MRTPKWRRTVVLLVAAAIAESVYCGSRTISIEEVDAWEKVRTACGGAERDLFSAGLYGHLFDLEFTSGTPRGGALCFLKTVDSVTFDSRDSDHDQRDGTAKMTMLVDPYLPSAYDFFAAQMKAAPERIHRGLREALVTHGQPEAIEEYFATRRVEIGEKKRAVTLIEPYQYREMLETGGCIVRPCSPRVNDLLAVISTNLDIVEKDLESVMDRRPSASSTPGIAEQMDERRADASQLLQLVGHIRRGEAT